MTRADWLNLIQVGLFFSQGLNLLLLMWHANIYLTGIAGLFIQSATFYLHLMGIKTDPTTGNVETPAK